VHVDGKEEGTIEPLRHCRPSRRVFSGMIGNLASRNPNDKGLSFFISSDLAIVNASGLIISGQSQDEVKSYLCYMMKVRGSSGSSTHSFLERNVPYELTQ